MPELLRHSRPDAAARTFDVRATRCIKNEPACAIRWALGALVVGLLMTERFGLAIGGSSLGASLPLTYGLLTVLWLRRRLVVDARSLLAYCGLVTLSIASYLLNTSLDAGDRISISSLGLLLALYLPFVFALLAHPHQRDQWLWTMAMTGNVLLLVALAGIVQFYAQFGVHAPWLFDISSLIPAPVRSQGLYHSVIPVGSLFKANGFVFREPSTFSFFMAFALVAEALLFKRPARMLCFGLALLLSYSGTGLLALAIGLLLPLRAQMLLRLGAGAAAVIALDAMAGDPLNIAFTWARLGEFSAQGSSAYMRYVAPLGVVDSNIDSRPWSALIGHGPGGFLKAADPFAAHDPTWAKLIFEYGLVGFLLVLGFVAHRLTAFGAPLPLVAMMLAYWLGMGGNLLIPETVCFLYVAFVLWAPASGFAAPMRQRGPR